MPNLITGLKYQSPNQTIETEQRLLEVFLDLRKQYSKFDQTFKISTTKNEPIKDFEHFLRIAVKEGQSVVLNGSGDIGGLDVRNASVEYDLSPVGSLTKHWNIYRNGSCHSCYNYYPRQDGMEMDHACKVMVTMDWSHRCPEYDAFRKNFEGKPARKLDELIAQAIK